MKHQTSPASAAPAAPLLAGSALALLLVTSCSGSGGSTDTNEPPTSPAVPPSYALALSDRDAIPGYEAYVLDLQTGQSRLLDIEFPGTTGIRRDSLEVSPEGRYAAVTSGDSLNSFLSIVDLRTSTRRTIERLTMTGEGGPGRGGDPPALVMFSPEDRRVAIQESPFERRIRVGSANGSSLTTYGTTAQSFELVQWLDADRLLVKSFGAASDHERLSILRLPSGDVDPISPTPGLFSSIEEVSVSGDGSTVAMLIDYEDASSSDFLHLFTRDLTTGTERTFDLFDVYEDEIALSHDGAFAAFVEDGGTNDRGVVLCDLTTGTSTRVNAPITLLDPQVRDLSFSPAGNVLSYTAEHEVEDADTLYILVPGNGTAVPVAATLATDAEVRDLSASPTGSALAFTYRDATNSDQRPAIVDTTDPGLALEFLDPSMAGNIQEYLAWSPDGAYVLGDERDANFDDVLLAYPAQGQGGAPIVLGPAWSDSTRINLASATDSALVVQLEGTDDLLYIGADIDGTGETLRIVDPAAPPAARTISLPAGAQGSDDRILQLYVRTLD